MNEEGLEIRERERKRETGRKKGGEKKRGKSTGEPLFDGNCSQAYS